MKTVRKRFRFQFSILGTPRKIKKKLRKNRKRNAVGRYRAGGTSINHVANLIDHQYHTKACEQPHNNLEAFSSVGDEMQEAFSSVGDEMQEAINETGQITNDSDSIFELLSSG
jgi:hypothetical protein